MLTDFRSALGDPRSVVAFHCDAPVNAAYHPPNAHKIIAGTDSHATIQLAQAQRDVVRLASPRVTLRQKERIRASRPPAAAVPANATPPAKRRGRPPKDTSRIVLAGVDPHGPVQAFLDRFALEQAERRRKCSAAGNDRKRAREFAAAVARGQ